MRVLHFVGYPLDYASGGHKDQIHNTIIELSELGVENEWLHNEKQDLSKKFDIVHFWSLPNEITIRSIKTTLQAKLVYSTMIPTAGKRNKNQRRILRLVAECGKKLKNTRFKLFFPEYDQMDAIIVLSELEKIHFSEIWGINEKKIFVVPNGIDNVFFRKDIRPIFFDGVLQIGAITEVKNSLEVAKAAKLAGIKVKFIGDFRLVDDLYRMKFIQEVDNKFVFWEGPINNKEILASHMKGCIGVIQPSKWESYPLVAAEALALNKKVLLPDLPNLRYIYKDSVFYCSQPGTRNFIKELNNFANIHISKTITFKPNTWQEVAKMILNIYNTLLK